MAYIEDDPTDGSPARYGTQPQPRVTNDPTTLFGAAPTTPPTITNGPITTQPGNVRETYDASAPLFGGGLTPTSPYVNNTKPRTYTGADGNTYIDDPNKNSVSGFVGVPNGTAQDFIKRWQQSHQASEGVQPLLDALKQGGYTNASPFMYGQQQSNNEITLDGQKFKVLGGEGTPGAYWYSGGNDSGGGAGAAGGGAGFADPAYNQLAQLVQDRLGKLGQPLSFPVLNDYMSQLAQDKQVAQQRAQEFASQLGSRIGQLQQPLLTDANVANQRAMASNGLLASRDAALKNNRERRFASGFAPTSGLIAGDERAVDENYNNRQASIDAQLQSQMIAHDEQRRNQATQLQGIAQQALRGGDLSSLQNQATMADMENQLFNTDQNRQREMLTTANVPVDLTNMGFANASNAANGGGNGMSSILQLLNLANGQQGLQQQQSNSNMGTLAFLLQTFLGPGGVLR